MIGGGGGGEDVSRPEHFFVDIIWRTIFPQIDEGEQFYSQRR